MFSLRNISIFLGLFAVNNIVSLTPSFGNPYYAVIFCGLFFILCHGNFEIKSYGLGIALLCAIIISLLINDAPDVSKSWLRLFAFVIVFALTGPFLRNTALTKAKIMIFWSVQWGTALIGVLSFPAKFLGLGRTDIQGNYAGLTVHSVTMGIVATNAFIFILYLFFTSNKNNKTARNLLLISLFFCLCGMLASGSRSAVLGAIGGACITLKNLFKLNGVEWKRYIFLLGIALIITFPIWGKNVKNIRDKNGGTLTEVNLDSRRKYWEDMWKVYCANPILGVGFASIHYGTVDGQLPEEDMSGKGQVEPGSSWLAVLSMTGSLGGIVIILLLLKTYYMLKKQFVYQKERTTLLASLLGCTMIHMCAEGYIYAAGGFGFFYFWCLLGTIWAYEDIDDIQGDNQASGKFHFIIAK